jgi:hypothetical protein
VCHWVTGLVGEQIRLYDGKHSRSKTGRARVCLAGTAAACELAVVVRQLVKGFASRWQPLRACVIQCTL